jgi:hypothetical protein
MGTVSVFPKLRFKPWVNGLGQDTFLAEELDDHSPALFHPMSEKA